MVTLPTAYIASCFGVVVQPGKEILEDPQLSRIVMVVEPTEAQEVMHPVLAIKRILPPVYRRGQRDIGEMPIRYINHYIIANVRFVRYGNLVGRMTSDSSPSPYLHPSSYGSNCKMPDYAVRFVAQEGIQNGRNRAHIAATTG